MYQARGYSGSSPPLAHRSAGVRGTRAVDKARKSPARWPRAYASYLKKCKKESAIADGFIYRFNSEQLIHLKRYAPLGRQFGVR